MGINSFLLSGGGVILAALTLIQISPIKINPWSAIARLFGKAINGEVIDKVDKITNEVDKIKKHLAETDALNCRTRILRFGDEVIHGTRHTKDHFDQTLRDIRDYELYCSQHQEFENGVTEPISIRIKEIYAKCLKDGSFLL